MEGLGREELVDLGGPLVVAGDDEPDAEPLGPLEVADRVRAGQADGHVVEHPVAGVEPGRQPVTHHDRPELGDQRHQAGVARFTEGAERHPGQPVLIVGSGHPAALPRRHASSSGRPRRRRSAVSSCVKPGASTRSRSVIVQASRCTRVAPRRVSRPE